MQFQADHVQNFIDSVEGLVIGLIKQENKKERIRREGLNGDILQAENGQNLKKVLHMKADKMDLERLFEIKSNKADTDGILASQAIMHD